MTQCGDNYFELANRYTVNKDIRAWLTGLRDLLSDAQAQGEVDWAHALEARLAIEHKEYDKALDLADQILAAPHDGTGPGRTALISLAYLAQGVALVRKNKFAAALEVYDTMIAQFSEDGPFDLRVQLARALFNRSIVLAYLREHDSMMESFRDLSRRFGSDGSPELRMLVAEGICYQAHYLTELKRYAEAIESWRRLAAFCLGDDDERMSLMCAQGYYNQGLIHELDGDEFAALSAYTALIEDHCASFSPERNGILAKTMAAKARIHVRREQYAEAVAVYDRLIQALELPAGTDAEDRRVLAMWERSKALRAMGSDEEAKAVRELIRRFRRSARPRIKDVVAKALARKDEILSKMMMPAETESREDERLVSERIPDDSPPVAPSPDPVLSPQAADDPFDKPILVESPPAAPSPVESIRSLYETARRLYWDEQWPEALAEVERLIALAEAKGVADCESVVIAAMRDAAGLYVRADREADAVTMLDRLIERLTRAGDGEGTTPAHHVAELAFAMVQKASILGRQEQYDPALAIYDTCINRFLKGSEFDLRAIVIRAMYEKGLILAMQQQTAAAIQACDRLLIVHREGTGIECDRIVAKTLYHKGFLLITLARYADAVEAHRQLIDRFGRQDDPVIRVEVATAYLAWADALSRWGQREECIQVCDRMIDAFADAEEFDIQDKVAAAMLTKGVTLDGLDRNAEAVAVYDCMAVRYSGTPRPDLAGYEARALYSKGLLYLKLQELDQETAAYDELIRRYRQTNQPALRALVGRAMNNKAIAMEKMGDKAYALRIYQELIDWARQYDDPELVVLAAQAKLGQAVVYSKTRHLAQAIEICDDLIAHPDSNRGPEAQAVRISALLTKATCLPGEGASPEAAAIYRQIVDEYLDTGDPVNQSLVARALYNLSYWQSDPTESAKLCRQLVDRFEKVDHPSVQEHLAKAFLNIGVSMNRLGQLDEEVAAYDQLIERFGEDSTLVMQSHVAHAMMYKAQTLSDQGRIEAAMATYQSVAATYGVSANPLLLEYAARSDLRRADLIFALGQTDEAMALVNQVLKRHAPSDTLRLRRQAVRACELKALFLEKKGRPHEAGQMRIQARELRDER